MLDLRGCSFRSPKLMPLTILAAVFLVPSLAQADATFQDTQWGLSPDYVFAVDAFRVTYGPMGMPIYTPELVKWPYAYQGIWEHPYYRWTLHLVVEGPLGAKYVGKVYNSLDGGTTWFPVGTISPLP